MAYSYRTLRQEVRYAHMVHICDHCSGFIFPGDQYEMTVQTLRNGSFRRFQTLKTHHTPDCPPEETRG